MSRYIINWSELRPDAARAEAVLTDCRRSLNDDDDRLLVVAERTDERTRIQIAHALVRADLRLTDLVVSDAGLALFEARGGLAPKHAYLQLLSQGARH
jgi:hypothetical protein